MPVVTDTRALRADARRNREKVLKVARRVFSEHGREAQMDDVARRAKVGVGTVYRHFPTKEALIEALVVDSFERIAAAGREALEIEDPWEAFEHVLWRGAELMAGDRALSQVFQALPDVVDAAAAAQAELRDSMAQIMARAQASGQLRADVLFDDIPMLMCGIGSATRKAHSRKAPWRRHLAIVIDGLRAGAATSSLPD